MMVPALLRKLLHSGLLLSLPLLTPRLQQMATRLVLLFTASQDWAGRLIYSNISLSLSMTHNALLLC